MVLAEDIKILSRFTAPALTRGIQLAGWKKDHFTRAQFLGITNSGQFCYSVTFKEDGETHKTKVFVDKDPETGAIRVDY